METELIKDIVIVINTEGVYPTLPPYNPDQIYPEYPWKSLNKANQPSEKNYAYLAIREFLHSCKFDEKNYGTDQWNPLGELVEEKKTVVIKPNWVFHSVHSSESILECLITHTSIIRAVIDYVFIAIGKNGKILIADAPIQAANFDILLERAHIPELVGFYKSLGVDLQVLDLRQTSVEFDNIKNKNIIKTLSGDPKGYVTAIIDNDSAFCEIEKNALQAYRNSDYDGQITMENHNQNKHRYLLSKTVLDADLFISLPKLKTHNKTGLTAALKNIVGINGDKRYLPHYRLGAPSEGGDAYPVANRWLKFRIDKSYKILTWPKFLLQILRPIGKLLISTTAKLHNIQQNEDGNDSYFNTSGGWYGNDTAWRMVTDLNNALCFCDLDGRVQKRKKRQWLTIVDGLIAGEGNGPLTPTPKKLGYIIAGFNPTRIDAVCAQLIGFDWKKIPLISNGSLFLLGTNDLENTKIITNKSPLINGISKLPPSNLLPPNGWVKHIEL